MPIEARRNLTQIRIMDDVTMSGIAQGDVIYHGTEKWQNLAAGTAGNLLATGGSGANPSWASRLTYASSGTILTVAAGAITDVPLVVNGVTSQSGDLAQFKVNGTTLAKVTASGAVRTASGTSSAPGLSFSADTNTGFYQDSTGVIRVAVTGAQVFAVTTSLSAWYGIPLNLYTSGGASGAGVSRQAAGVIKLTDASTGYGALVCGSPTAATIATTIVGITSQSAPLLQLQGQSSTTAGRAQAEVDTAWVVDTDASRTSRLLLRTYYTSTAQEGLRIDSASDQARVAVGGSVVSGQRLTVYGGSTTEVPLVVDGAASASGNLQQWKVNGTTKSYMTKDGYLVVPAGSYGSDLPLVIGSSGTGFYKGVFGLFGSFGSSASWQSNSTIFQIAAAAGFTWSASGDAGGSAADTGLSRSAAGVVQVNNGTAGTYRDLKLRAIEMVDGNLVLGTTTGTKIGTATGQKLAFWDATPVVQQVLATGAGATVDNVISLLQTLGLCKQS